MKKFKENFKNYTFLLKSYYKNCKLYFIGVTIFCLLTPIDVIIDTFLLQIIIDSILNGINFTNILIYIVIYFLVKIIGVVIENFSEIYLGEKKAIEINSKINKELLKKL